MTDLSGRVGDILEPLVGKIVAHAMVEKQCKGMGLEPSELTLDRLDELANRIEKVLIIFGHDEKAVGVKIRALR